MDTLGITQATTVQCMIISEMFVADKILQKILTF